MESILIIDDESFIRENVERILLDEGYRVYGAASGTEARDMVTNNEIDLALLDLNLGPENGLDVLKNLKEIDQDLLVIIITGYGSVETAVDAMKLGAFHYLKKPFKADALRVIVKLALKTQVLKREVRNLKRADGGLPGGSPMIGNSPAFRDIISQIGEIAPIPSTVLITGESGTGKELVARAIHSLSNRRDAPFVAINCAAIPATLLESELFGHERGAFTGAVARKTGLFEEASGGTIFLDEIGDMYAALQAKLLRVLQERSVRRVGGNRDMPVNIRVITATNRDLQERITMGTFREDLYYRLNVIPIHLPPLRERREDIGVLAKYFLDSFSRSFGKLFQGISSDAVTLLEQYSWPGNIRELRNIIERICIMRNAPLLMPEFLPPEIQTMGAGSSATIVSSVTPCNGLEDAVADFERRIIMQALETTGGNVLQAATCLKIPRGTLRYKMEKYGL